MAIDCFNLFILSLWSFLMWRFHSFHFSSSFEWNCQQQNHPRSFLFSTMCECKLGARSVQNIRHTAVAMGFLYPSHLFALLVHIHLLQFVSQTWREIHVHTHSHIIDRKSIHQSERASKRVWERDTIKPISINLTNNHFQGNNLYNWINFKHITLSVATSYNSNIIEYHNEWIARYTAMYMCSRYRALGRGSLMHSFNALAVSPYIHTLA